MAGYIHDDVKEIMKDASTNPKVSTQGWTEEQLQALNVMLQYAWNRGYKSACQDRNSED